jgi:hypothetical protein
VAVHNEIVRRRPDLAALLYREIPRSRLGEEIGGERCYYPLPVFAVREGRFTSHYSRTFVEAGQKDSNVPRMSAAQWEALDLLAEVASESSDGRRCRSVSRCSEHSFSSRFADATTERRPVHRRLQHPSALH